MVRGTSVDGFNLVPQWLTEGHVSLSATQLGSVDPGASYDDLKQQVEAAYQHKSYAYRGQRLEEFDGSELRAPVPALLRSQAYVVDPTEAYDQLAALVPRRAKEKPPSVRITGKPQRTLSLRPVTAELAAGLLMDAAELDKIRDLLWERRQLIFYGPPGTGKTYLATRLARHLTEDGAVKPVQFHPSYTCEDFWPKCSASGTSCWSTGTPGSAFSTRRWLSFRVWQHEIIPLLEDLFYGQRDLASHYGLESLRKAVAPRSASPACGADRAGT